MVDSKDNFDDKIKYAITEAKLQIAEKRIIFILAFFGILLTVAGVILPLLMTNRAIDKMEANFEKLANTQLREPDLDCFLNGNELKGQILVFLSNKMDEYVIILKNIGNTKAEGIRIRLLLEEDYKILGLSNPSPWEALIFSRSVEHVDEPGYLSGLRYNFLQGEDYYSLRNLDATEEIPITIPNFVFNKYRDKSVRVMLKIYYGQPQAKRIPFNIIIKSSSP